MTEGMVRKNNFDFLRLIFASFVIVSHSNPLSGNIDCDWLCQITNGQMLFSSIGVKGFFVISGYLIFQSLLRSQNLADYYWKRILRLFPALFVVLLLTVLLAPIVYENTSVSYLSNETMWSYLPNNLLLYPTQYYISGVFENNPYKGAINGSLWTIPYEFTMYVLLSLLIFFRKNIFIIKLSLITIFCLLAIGNIFYMQQLMQPFWMLNGWLFVDVGVYFMAGSILASLQIEKYKHFDLLTVISIFFVVTSIMFNVLPWVKIFTLPIIILFAGLKSTPIINNIGNKIGDLSYGIYIYAFPVQQTLIYFLPLNAIELMILSLVISYILAYLSWHLIESKALKLKKLSFLKK
jgi:peptidoglycan/LPS O-acetylase OafA/YrhL